jgi:hypothetical protein
MIPCGVLPTTMRLDPRELVVLDSDHAEPLDPWAVDHYTRLLTERPNEDTDPLLVVRDGDGHMRVRRGRHRFLANVRAGRTAVLAMVYQETGDE